MRVIGTAGHVDHGKTALIKALSGIDADRLPEEKARGMTIDLGFAWFTDTRGQPVGIVDVPGHERYLRNMVAGAWGLDLALLVVAADDGWMPQSQLHAAILESIGCPAIILAITKTDLVPTERTKAVMAEAIQKAAAIFGQAPEAIAVSATTGQGIDTLKTAIEAGLARLPTAQPGNAWLYIDRTFTSRSGGTVVTGTLRNGILSVGDTLQLLPRGEKLRIRAIETYHKDTRTAIPNCRVALSITAPKTAPQRGDLLVMSAVDMLSNQDFICWLAPIPGTDQLSARDAKGRLLVRPAVQAEVALGSARQDATLWPLRIAGFIRLHTAAALACPAGLACTILRKGGSELIARGTIIASGLAGAADRRTLEACLPQAMAIAERLAGAGWSGGAVAGGAVAGGAVAGSAVTGSAVTGSAVTGGAVAGGTIAGHATNQDVRTSGMVAAAAIRLSIQLQLRGWVKAPPGLDSATATRAGLETALAQPGERPFLFTAAAWQNLTEAVISRAAQARAMLKADAEAACGLQGDCVMAIITRLLQAGWLVKNGAGWTIPDKHITLDPLQTAVLERLRQAGSAGLEPGKSVAASDARVLKTLCSLDLAVPLESGIFFSKDSWDQTMVAILQGRQAGEHFTVPEAKERSGLSRKYILPVLNRMEDRGLVKRSGDVRIVIKALPAADTGSQAVFPVRANSVTEPGQKSASHD
jgi:small GTP-binding protein